MPTRPRPRDRPGRPVNVWSASRDRWLPSGRLLTPEETPFLSIAADYSEWMGSDELPGLENDLRIRPTR
ncbi:hypothetical protein GCM10010510_42910 [Streptomyces anandii JCM 4720]|nr:hypothetical protein GCM10010510_42910 [Streptomyces anandii JCM 4720]